MTPEEIKQLALDGKKTVDELRALAENTRVSEAERKEKIAKMESSLAKFDEANAKMTKDILEERKANEELKEKLITLEKIASRPVLSGSVKEKSEELKAFEKFIIKGDRNFNAEEMKYLRTDSGPDGGFLAPSEYIPEVIKKITEISPMRSQCRVRNTSKGKIEIPKRTSLIQGYWVGEGEEGTEGQSKYGLVEIQCHKMIAVARVTVEALNDSAFSLESELNADIAETFALLEGKGILTGSGNKQPEGIIGSTSVQTKKSGLAATYTGDNLIQMCGMLKTGYNPIFGLNRTELAFLRSLKDGQGRYIWIPGLSEGRPNTINGYPYMEMPDLEVQGAGKYPVILGDFRRGYTMVDDTVMGFIRDPYSESSKGIVKFVTYRRLGGAVSNGEAIVKLQCATV